MNWQKIPWRLLRLLAAGAVLAVFAVLYLWPEAVPPALRRVALSSQFTTWTAVAGGGLIIAAVALAATFLFGRVYCSVLCPAGFLQEIAGRLGGLLGLRRLRYRPASGGGRILLLFLVAAATLSGFVLLVNFLDPLGLFGRTGMAAGRGLSFSGGTVALALALLGTILLIVVPLFRARWFCDRACPVGAVLGLAASAGQRGIALDSNKCTGCGRCSAICPARAINSREKRLDAARCVLCLDCPAVCPTGALAYRRAVWAVRTAAENQPAAAEPVVAGERRGFLRSTAAAGAAGLYILSRPIAGLLAPAAPDNSAPDVTPPGAGGFAPHHAGCVSCQACVAACPVGIVRMAPGSALRPVLDFTRGYCQYNCVACAEICPAGVLRPIPLEEKQRTRMGRTTLELDRCVAVTLNQACGACAEVCPTHAVRMVAAGEGRATVPDFDPRYCVGCGACYHVCPVEPRAFRIVGLAEHERTEGIRPGGHGASAAGGDELPGPPAGGEGVGEFPF